MKISSAVERITPDMPSPKDLMKVVSTGAKVMDRVLGKVTDATGSSAVQAKVSTIGRAIMDKGQSLFSESTDGSRVRQHAKEFADKAKTAARYANLERRDLMHDVERNTGSFWDTAGDLINAFQPSEAPPVTASGSSGLDAALVGPIVIVASIILMIMLCLCLYFMTIRHFGRRHERRQMRFAEYSEYAPAKYDSRQSDQL
ncbi:unnamed protein product [Oikopleura dioica]|uniref:Uncharacterized protein n=1 Tax=Oikopleura dioica TaxID=34765 RepID=E4YT28_OIKDI|nr:unnamed protein product [Oikopleura dioica]